LAAALLIVLTLGIVAIVNKNEALPPEETFIADNTLEDWQSYTDFLISGEDQYTDYSTDFQCIVCDERFLGG